uniref:Uncharacterized protein n=1 Tax=Haptolina brevifila TaxID=156173 RepID=A0A7S2NFL8_9EUKA|mmetsp:Transcript_76953/g.152667  ORF Transcript_76953/g.152667 Transcript_76953/m.152667 type:complete len:223 (+) Transcript_76953:62-730(+)
MSARQRIRQKISELGDTPGVNLIETADTARDRAVLCFKASKHEAALDQLILLAACEELQPTNPRDKGAIMANVAKCLHHIGTPFDVEANGFYDEAIKLLGPIDNTQLDGCSRLWYPVEECLFGNAHEKRVAYVKRCAERHASGQTLSMHTYLDGSGEERTWSSWDIQEATSMYEELKEVLFPPRTQSPPGKFKFSLTDVSEERLMKGDGPTPVPSTPRGTLW